MKIRFCFHNSFFLIFVLEFWDDEKTPKLPLSMLPTITAERKTPLLPPMITEEELPDWLTLDEEDVRQKVAEEETKRISALSGRRQRKEVRYHDELTENEWLHAVGKFLKTDSIVYKLSRSSLF